MHALLGLDLGTTGVKAALFAADDGRVLSTAFIEYPLFHPHPGWAEQDPADWWQATISAIRTCLVGAVRHNIQPEDVRGIGLSGQMHGVVLLDEHHQVLRPCIIWADQRSEAQCRWITERVGAARLIELVAGDIRPRTPDAPAQRLHSLSADGQAGNGNFRRGGHLLAGCEAGYMVSRSAQSD